MRPPGIPREPKLPPALDYERLRREGISRIEALGSALWTDYNTHDPGITLLETVCFAINDLAYRCAFPMRDLLAPPPDRPRPGGDEGPLFSARSIFTCNPVTVLDYRKLLVDVEGVRNAWLIPSATPCLPIYTSRETGLGKQPPPDDPGARPVTPRGVYSVVLELADDPLLGNLNDTTHVWHPRSAAKEKRLPRLEIVFPRWDEWRPPVPWEALKSREAGAIEWLPWDAPWLSEAEASALTVQGQAVDKDKLKVQVRVDVPAQAGGVASRAIAVDIRLQGSSSGELSSWQEAIVRELERPGHDNPLELYRQRLRKAFSVARQAMRTLQQHRALCEDFLEPVAARFEEISLCAEVDVKPDTDIEELQAQILIAVARLLTPPVRFRTLPELLAEDTPVERIFEGPALEHGFLLNEDLAASEPAREVHSSDILGQIMDQEGVVAVRSLSLMAHAPDGRRMATDERWKIDLMDGHLPRLAPDRCRLVFFKDDIPYATNAEEVEHKLEFLTSKEGMLELTQPAGLRLDLEPPVGAWKALEEYRLLQHDLPRVYGIGSEGLPESASPRRKAQARQLQAYLLLFDQLLANSLAQLSHLRELFSLAPTERTFFGEPLFRGCGRPRPRKSPGQEDQGEPEDPCRYPELRDLFQEAPIRRAMESEAPRDELAEDEETYLERRNQFLDHLLARFNERFTEYAAVMSLPDRGRARDRRGLVEDKIAFLKDYPRLSSGRGTGFDTGDAARLWDFDNVSGLERRLCGLLGLRHRERRSLTNRFKTQRDSDGEGAGYLFLRLDASGKELLRSPSYRSEAEAEIEMNALETYAARRDCYQLKQDEQDRHRFELLKPSGRVIGHGGPFSTRAEAEAAIEESINDTRESEGLHLVEHILLRPISTKCELLGSAPDPECAPCLENADPYSFRATLLLPGWAPRFTSPSFRAFVEHTARMEAPAHVALKICWVSIGQMRQFEAAVLPWLKARAELAPDPTTLSGHQKALVEALQSLRSVYPEATLHDFEENLVENPVLLGRTQLGDLPEEPQSE